MCKWLALFLYLFFHSVNIISAADFAAGMKLLQDDEYKKARQLFSDYTVIYSSDSRGWNNLGFCFFKEGDFAEALKNYDRAVLLDPSYVTAHNNAGIASLKLKDYGGAKKHFEKAVLLKPGYSKAWINLGLVYLKQKDKKTAEKMFRKAKETDSGYFDERLESAKTRYGKNPEKISE